MRIVIVGGGTAGHMALAHVSKHLPSAELIHVFDSRRATIGVGEGTTPDFVNWLSSVGITVDDLARECQATRKRGLRFEGWGKHKAVFDHEFLPRSEQAVHFSASRLPVLLASRSSFEHIDESVQAILPSGEGSVVMTDSGNSIDAELVIDARGFGLDPSVETHRCDWITTDSALVAKFPVTLDLTITRAIARPLGWIFMIPLADETSCGYVYNSQISNQLDVRDDFNAFLNREHLPTAGATFRNLSFPNYVRREVFDGRVFHIGNCASFLEPLEATAIGVITLQLQLLMHWQKLLTQGMTPAVAIDRINRIHEDTLLKVSIFIAWHYAAGTIYDTPFWQNATDRFQQLQEVPALAKILQQFATIQQSAATISDTTLAALNTTDDVTGHSLGNLHQEIFGGYTKLSFAQIARGLALEISDMAEATTSRRVERVNEPLSDQELKATRARRLNLDSTM